MSKPKKERTPQEEERIAKQRRANAAKAQKARLATLHAKKADAIWPDIEKAIRAQGCTCGLKKGMTLQELRKLNAGCTAPQWVCSVLLKYRTLLKKQTDKVDTE